jgi:hypothetical protein
MKRSKIVAIIIATLAVAIVGGLISLNVAAGRRTSALLSQNQQQQPEDPTPVQEGVMTKRQREHSKLYRQEKRDTKLRDEVAATGDVKVIVTSASQLTKDDQTLQQVLRNYACASDAVVVGTVKDKTSQLTEDGTFVFTDYDFTVEDVLKDNVEAHIQPGTDIVVTRPGGKVLLNGHTATVLDRSHLPLEKGSRYLFFLRFVKTTGAYSAIGKEDAFRLDDDKVAVLRESTSIKALANLNTGARTLIAEVRAVAAGPCDQPE